MKAPSFWYKNPPNIIAKILFPLSCLTSCITQYRVSKTKPKVEVPVICCGNLTVGGTGKTILALEIGSFYKNQGIHIAFLTRGYKKKKKQPIPFKVNSNIHTFNDVGDEALLLSQIGDTWIGSNRFDSAQKAIQHGAELLIMDDGFQNPTLYQDLPILILDGTRGFGNQLCLPAGPCREKLCHGVLRAKVCICIDKDEQQILPLLPSSLPVFHAALEMDEKIKHFKHQSVIAFAGIGRPKKFFQALRANGLTLAHSLSFPDHYNYRNKDFKKLLTLKRRLDLPLVTTPKDYVKLPEILKSKITALDVHLRWDDDRALTKINTLLQNEGS
ncbi:Tetraacyldisaccharide 4'-kinase [Commensalibacter sp. Nvir]|uniref:tetraacyldisaccharide 4'-kinase n=1 Tax=Commensalibacter sp. Nvir TaxID=3069817 RepID=UPI002D75007B|nr:Tetraacyldisaccharide 4'-kinase [Commensalibacter sp. Nvir]